MSETDGRAMVESPAGPLCPEALKFVPDVYTHDGDEYTLGSTTVRCIDTPGHTRGCQSFFVNVTGADGTRYTAALHGGVGINTLHRDFMEKTGYPQAREDFFGHIQRIIDWPVDIYLSSHTFQNYTEEKLAKRRADPAGPNPFVDPGEWHSILTTAWEMGHQLVEDEKNGLVPEWQRQTYADLKEEQ